MGKFDPDILEEIKDKIDIVQLVSRYVPLKRAGRNFQALCPFHQEKTPSFTVSPEKQFFHCFGCNASGDVFQFVMKMENLTFPEALEMLAKEAGVEIPPSPGYDRGKDRLYALHETATQVFHKHLLSPEGALAREMALARGMDAQAWDRFQLGYAPEDWDALRREMHARGFSADEMLAVGLLGRREKGEPYVKFRHRLMIPIWDTKGRVVAFGGRALAPDQEPKYLNSPEHPAFRKGEILYPYHLARKPAKDMGYLLLVEGYMDAITCHLRGFPNALAAMGTALTPSQAKKLARLSREVVLAYDGDEAGKKATVRAAGLFFSLGVVPKILLLPQGEDPDSLLRTQGDEVFRGLISHAQDVVLWFMDEGENRYDITHPGERAKWLTEAVEFLSPLEDPILQESYLAEAASRAKVTLEALKAKLQGKRKIKRVGSTYASGSWEMLYLALALTRREWWSSFKGEVLRDSRAVTLWNKVKGEVDPSSALSLLEEDERALLVGKAMEVPWEDMEGVFLACDRRAQRGLLEEEARGLKRRMQDTAWEERTELLERYMALMKTIKGLKEEGLHETH